MGSQAAYIASGISREQARQCQFVQQMVSLNKHVGLHSLFSNSVGPIFCFAPVIFSGARFGPQFDYSCIKGGTKFGSHFWLPFSFFPRSTFIKKRMQNEFSQPDYCRTLLYQSTLCMLWVAYITAIGYGVDEAVWINVVETPIPYHVGGRRGWKKPPRTRIQRSNG